MASISLKLAAGIAAFAGFLPVLVSTQASNCYRVDGELQDSKYGWVPCSPDRPSSPCCSGIDYCLDNGLCLNAGVVNNVFTIQGCTDPSWGGDCRKFCPGSIGRYYLLLISPQIRHNQLADEIRVLQTGTAT